MGKYSKRVDANDKALVDVWVKMGVSVLNLTRVGEGCPDKLLGITSHSGHRINVLVEVKDGAKPSSARKLTNAQEKFHTLWKGQVCIVTTVEEAIALVNGVKMFGRVTLPL